MCNVYGNRFMRKLGLTCFLAVIHVAIFGAAQDTVNALNKQADSALNQVDSIRNEAFSNVPDSLMPLSPNEIKELRRVFNSTQQAGAFVQDVPAKPVSSTVMVDISPGASPPVVRLSSGFVSSLVFLDSTGAPWPIQAYDLGDPKSFNIQWSQASGDNAINNTLMIQAITMYKVANLAVVLQGLNTPIMLTLVPGQEVVDYRVDLRCPGMGPNARPVFAGMPAASNSVLIDVLNGVLPSEAKALRVTGGDASAWKLGKTMYLRTKMNVVSPSWIATMSGSDGGVNAFEMPLSSVVLALQNGSVHKLHIEGI